MQHHMLVRRATRLPLTHFIILLLAFTLARAAQAVPSFEVQLLGDGVPVDTNAAGLVVGQDTYVPGRPWVFDGLSRTLLPLPGSATSATVTRIGETGTVTGQIGNQAAVWWRSGGGYALELLPFPPGATVGKALDVNRGDTVLITFGTPSRLVTGLEVWTYKPWLYTRAGGLVDLSARYPTVTTFADPVDLTDSGRVLLLSGQILESDGTVTPTPAFPPRPPGGPSWIAMRAARINEAGSFVGVAILSTSQNYAQVVRYAQATGWSVLGGLSLNVGALGLDSLGNSLLMANFVCASNFGVAYNSVADAHTYCLDDLVLGGGWSFLSFSARGTLSDKSPNPLDPLDPNPFGAIAGLGYNSAAGAYKLAWLRPAGPLPKPAAVSLSAIPHPGTATQPYDAITLKWSTGDYLTKAYVIERRNPGTSAFVEIARVSASLAQYDDTAITPLATYSYRVAASGLAGQSPWSNEVTAQAPAAMDRTAPEVTITSPAEGATVSGTVTVSATFTDNIGLVFAQLAYSPTLGSGVLCQSTPTTAQPTLKLSCKWDTRKVANRAPTATVTAYGYDALGNWVSKAVNVKVTYGRIR